MKKFLIMLIIFGQLGIGHYNPITKRFDLYEDESGKRVGTIEENKIKDQYDIRDRSGKRTGTIHWNEIKDVWVIEKE